MLKWPAHLYRKRVSSVAHFPYLEAYLSMITGTHLGVVKTTFGIGLSMIFVGIVTTITMGTTDDKSFKNQSESPFQGDDDHGRPVEKRDRGYISSANCRDCHAEHYESWHASYHRTMTQVPSRENVIADFDNKILKYSGYQFRFFREEEEYFMEMNGVESNQNQSSINRTFKIVLSTGAHHQQAFWCETDKQRTLAKIPFIWINKEQRWVPYGSIFLKPSSNLNMHAGGWNSNCIKCHVVSGQPRLDRKTGFDTHVAEFGISCEACHGPGQAHAAFHGQHVNDRDRNSALGETDLCNPATLSHKLSSQTCGQCHAVFDLFDAKDQADFFEKGFEFRPGEDLHKNRYVFQFGKGLDQPVVRQKLKRNPKFFEQQFWSDGMVRVSGREYNGLLETPCYQRGTMSCLSCHDMHQNDNVLRDRGRWADDQMKRDMRTNRACLQCHDEFRSDSNLVLHTHHPVNSEGSLCYNCHMPHTSLGLMKAMRSHTIDSPNVATTQSTGRPNACNLCHLDKSLGWTANQLKKWYKIPTPILSADEKEIASSIRWVLQGDAGQRAIAGWHFGWKPARQASGTRWMPPYLAELLVDTYDVVRFNGYHSLKAIPEFSDFQFDYVGSRTSRQNGRARALRIWNALEASTASTALLIDDSGKIDQTEFNRLRQKRLDPKMTLVE